MKVGLCFFRRDLGVPETQGPELDFGLKAMLKLEYGIDWPPCFQFNFNMKIGLWPFRRDLGVSETQGPEPDFKPKDVLKLK